MMDKSVRRLTRQDKFLDPLIGAVYEDAKQENSCSGYRQVQDVIYKLWGLEEKYKNYIVPTFAIIIIEILPDLLSIMQ